MGELGGNIVICHWRSCFGVCFFFRMSSLPCFCSILGGERPGRVDRDSYSRLLLPDIEDSRWGPVPTTCRLWHDNSVLVCESAGRNTHFPSVSDDLLTKQRWVGYGHVARGNSILACCKQHLLYTASFYACGDVSNWKFTEAPCWSLREWLARE